MRYLVSIISVAFSILLVTGQADTLIENQLWEIEEVAETQCDSIIDIYEHGNVDYKLVFKQLGFDLDNENLIVIPHTKTDIDDNSVLYSGHTKLKKTILMLGYDTCYVRNFKKRDNKRKFKSFSTPPDISTIKDWQVDIDFKERGCTDTDYYSVRIRKNISDYIDFICARRIQIYELDLNNDTLNEIYLISYIWCASEIKVYRIDIKQDLLK